MDISIIQATLLNETIIIKEMSITQRFKCARLCADLQECNMFCVSTKSCTLFNTIIGILNESQKSYLWIIQLCSIEKFINNCILII